MNHSHDDLSPEEQEFGIWLENGIERGWVTPPYCNTHDGGYEYMGEEEQEEWGKGWVVKEIFGEEIQKG